MAREPSQSDRTMMWIRRGSALAVLLIGWVFILVINNFHITPPVVFLALGYFAAVAAIYTLFRTGATAVAADDATPEGTWGRPAGAAAELEREKRSLLKAIKEAEFDHQMGKLSKADADTMIASYRARAIEVIKELDVLASADGETGSVRDRILREARARLEVESKVDGAKKRAGKNQKPRAAADAAATAAAGKATAGAAEPAPPAPDAAPAPAGDAPAGDGGGPADAAPATDDAAAAASATDASTPGSKEAVS